MIFVALVQFAVVILIVIWLLKQKPGEKYSGKSVMKFLLFGALGTVLALLLTEFLSLHENSFFGMNPFLSGFLTALVTASLLEEISKYLLFRLAIWKNSEVVCWLDAIIAAVLIGAGFTLMEDLTYVGFGDGNLLRAILPGHILFQAIMGYYYGKARVTKQFRYHVLSLAAPILCHTAFDMFIIGMKSVVADAGDIRELSESELMSLPYANYLIPLIICTVATLIIMFIALILFLSKISIWSKNGEKQELLGQENS